MSLHRLVGLLASAGCLLMLCGCGGGGGSKGPSGSFLIGLGFGDGMQPYSVSVRNGSMTLGASTVMPGVDLDFSPDGKKVVYSNFDSGCLYVANADGTAPVLLADGGASDPSFSPDGVEIVFSRGDVQTRNIWRVNSDGSGLTQLTHFEAHTRAEFPVYNSDGTKIAFGLGLGGSDSTNLDVMDADGTNVVRVYSKPADIVASGRIYGPPAFSPDGAKLVFSTNSFSFMMYPQLVRIDLPAGDAGGLTFLTEQTEQFNLPAFSPDGKTLVARECAPWRDLYIIPQTPGSTPTQLTHIGAASAEVSRPCWVTR